MRLVLEGKSLAVGALAGAAFVGTLGAMQLDGRSATRGRPPGTPQTESVDPEPSPYDPGMGVPGDGRPQVPGEVGRFQIEAAGDGNSITAYVVDTATGKVWKETGVKHKDFMASKLEAGK
jgi:hypothetical protein